MAETAEHDDPALWARVKEAVTKGDKGGKPGQWSARKAQLATVEYKKQGGGYVGPKTADNALQQWSDEQWGTKSGRKSGETHERYLPRRAREALSDEAYRRTSAKKKADDAAGRQYSAQPEDIAKATAPYRDGTSKADLYARARQRGIKGRSRMSKAELARALAG
ncbi:hypothetical protein [Sphingomonas morindae]|uniref:DUF5872 domain-containing protein n=1 Tax=Sphingomonas morindae TaxID=1541170 RepID=A0ABY4X8H6_9SPHN|nr:hypothetical protein [Sphingomonas morindae]USI73140.1 hypothetical protein LHA26_01260 [Sphingomonas morindae]